MERQSLSTNVCKNVVVDSLVGLTAINQEIILFDFGNVVALRNFDKIDNVKILIGGCSGLEPAYAGFVGNGMATAAVQGDKYVAPPSKIILRTIRELSYNFYKGILIIVQKTSGDLLNFGVAVERAITDGLTVKLLSVGDDSMNKILPKVKKRISCGIVLIQKIAGAMSARDKCLQEIYVFCKAINNNLKSAVLALEVPHAFDSSCQCKRNSESKPVELGKGLLGEPGIKKFKKENILDDCSNLLKEIISEDFVLEPGSRVVVLLNNLGGSNKMDVLLIVNTIVPLIQAYSVNIERFYVGKYMTSALCHGFSMTILKNVDSEILNYLDDPCTAPAWREVNQGKTSITTENIISGNLKKTDRLSPPIRGPKLDERAANVLYLCVQFACDALISCERQLNTIDYEKGDGDTGTRLKTACEVLLMRLKSKKLITNYPFAFFESLSKILESNVGGSLGCIYSILFEAAAKYFGNSTNPSVRPHIWLACLFTACKALKRYGNIELGDGTMYDPLMMCAQTVQAEFDNNANFLEAFGHGVSIAEKTAQNTKHADSKYPDSGAHAVGIWMRAVYEGVKLRCPV